MDERDETRRVDPEWPTSLSDRHPAARSHSVLWPTRRDEAIAADDRSAAQPANNIEVLLPSPARPPSRQRAPARHKNFGSAVGNDGKSAARDQRFIHIASFVCLLVWSIEIVRALWTEIPAWM